MNLKIWMICCIGVWAIPAQAQLSLQYAQGFRVDYFDAYRVVTVLAPGMEYKKSFSMSWCSAGTSRPMAMKVFRE